MLFLVHARKKRVGFNRASVSAIAADRLFRGIASGLTRKQIRSTAGVAGIQQFESRGSREPAFEQRERARIKNDISRKALMALARLPGQYKKMPSTEALQKLKTFFINELFNPQGQIKSFEAMREFLKQQGICASEENFISVFNNIFSIKEKELLERVFQEKLERPNDLSVWNR